LLVHGDHFSAKRTVPAGLPAMVTRATTLVPGPTLKGPDGFEPVVARRLEFDFLLVGAAQQRELGAGLGHI
jgi:hypothetical protein